MRLISRTHFPVSFFNPGDNGNLIAVAPSLFSVFYTIQVRTTCWNVWFYSSSSISQWYGAWDSQHEIWSQLMLVWEVVQTQKLPCLPSLLFSFFCMRVVYIVDVRCHRETFFKIWCPSQCSTQREHIGMGSFSYSSWWELHWPCFCAWICV